MNADNIRNYLERLEDAARKELERHNYEMSLQAVSIASRLLYRTNLKYADEQLEAVLKGIAEGLRLKTFDGAADEDTVVFYDGFGLENRGLALIYLKAISKVKMIVYITLEEKKSQIPTITSICEEYGHKMYFLDRKGASEIERINELNEIVLATRAKQFIFYSTPDDVIATTLMYAYEGIIERIQINLTDHAFWIGKNAIDKCIEFRDYGASISKHFRNIPENKIVIIPFYPNIEKNVEFQGYPFDKKEDTKVVFSGGALYKTLSEDNLYCEIVERIVANHENVIFWYAGVGENPAFEALKKRYPEKIVHTAERSDLFKLLENCDMYLSTYPMCGGLMFQYAAMAGIVPVTFKHDNISDDFLINQTNIGIEYTSLDEMFEEIDKLLTDKNYWTERSKLMKRSVISPQQFDQEVRDLLQSKENIGLEPSFKEIDTKSFTDWYTSGISKQTIYNTLLSRHSTKFSMKYFPIMTTKALFGEAMKRAKNKLHK